MGFTNQAVSAMLNTALGDDADDVGVMVALFTGDTVPSDTGVGGTEPSGASYKRVEAHLKLTNGEVKQYQNHDIIQFPIARGDGWGWIKYVGIYKNGQLMFWDELEEEKEVEGNTIPVFDIGELIIGIDRPDDELAAPNPVPPTN